MSAYKERTPGAWWDWSYRDAIPTGQNIPNFEIQGRKSLLSFVTGGRKSLSSSQLASNTRVTVMCFLPKPDHSVDQFASSLLTATKTAVTISRNISHIHLCVTCSSMEEFDGKIAGRIPSGVNVWADINGELAEKFGVRPMMAEVHVSDILAEDDDDVGRGGNARKKPKYSKQTVSAMFFCIGTTVVKSPVMQPKLQVVSLDTLKSVLESLEAIQFSVSGALDKKHFASSLTESEIQSRFPKDWSSYLLEYQQMQEDLGLKAPSSSSSSAMKAKSKGATRVKKTTTPTTGAKKKVATSATRKKPTTGNKKKKVGSTTTAKKAIGDKNLLPDGSIRSRL